MLNLVKKKIVHNFSKNGHLFYHNLRIGCASGFWGDTSVATPQLIEKGKLDFLIFDYLSEITMSLLVKARFSDSTKGYTPDFLHIAKYARQLKDRNIRVVTNAGGINPHGCCRDLKAAFDKAGVDLKIAVVTGDDMMSNKLHCELLERQNVDRKCLLSSNVYFGATPIQVALDHGADVVVTGRCVDSALALGPLMHHFKWTISEFDKLAAGSLAGHLIECGAQATGGIFTDCFTVPDWWNIGFPLVEVQENGLFFITKPEGTGGIVSRATVAEQLVYEIGDPSQYFLPDVTCDFRNVSLNEISENKVAVSGVKGFPPPAQYKVSSVYMDKHRLTAVAILIGKDAISKGYLTAEQIMKRVRHILNHCKLPDFTRTKIQVIGAEESYGAHKNETLVKNVREAVIWIAAEHENQTALKILAAEIAPAGTGMAPGLTGLVGGRPKVTPVLKLHSGYVDKKEIKAVVSINGQPDILVSFHSTIKSHNKTENTQSIKLSSPTTSKKTFKLRELAYARSGDKGDTCNIGVIARDDEAWSVINSRLTTEIVGEYLQHFFPDNNWRSNVERYELPGIKALNFVLNKSLDGGGVSSLQIDPQGKSYAQILLDINI